jgi:hypothetical protein
VPHAPLFPTLYRHGTIFAAVSFCALAVYYDLAWRSLKHRLIVSLPPNVEPRPWSALQYLAWGVGSSVLCFMLAGAADTPTFLDHVVGALMGLCGTVFAFLFGFGLVALWSLWRESIQQLKGELRFRRYIQSYGVKPLSFLPAIPLAILGLAFGVGVFLALGTAVPYVEKWRLPIRELLWLPIVVMFYALWKGRSHAALLVRLILLVLFSLIILPFAVFLLAWSASQTAPLLVTILAAITILNAAFYARWVRQQALINNFE